MKKQKLAPITAQELKRRPWRVHAHGGTCQLLITAVNDDGAISGKFAGRKMFGTFLTFEPECAAPWRQEFGWFAEQQ